MIKSAPGHSPDHQVLFLKLTKAGPTLLSGDPLWIQHDFTANATIKKTPAFYE